MKKALEGNENNVSVAAEAKKKKKKKEGTEELQSRIHMHAANLSFRPPQVACVAGRFPWGKEREGSFGERGGGDF